MLAVAAFFILCRGVGQEIKPASSLADLRQRLETHVSQPKFAAGSWGVKVVSLDTGKTLFERNPRVLFSPASNSKLYTVALGLDRLGTNYQIRTSLYSKSAPDKRGTLDGDLIIFGRGDPTINARLNNNDIYQALEPLVVALTNAGVKRIKGDIIADDSFIHGPEYGSGWDWDDFANYYGAEISALTVNDNTLQATVRPGDRVGAPCKISLTPDTSWLVFSNRTRTVEAGAKRTLSLYHPVGENVIYASGNMPLGGEAWSDDVTFHRPAGLFAMLFKEALAKHGIKVGGRARSAGWLERQAAPVNWDSYVEVGYMLSPPLNVIAREIQKPSQNLYTDLLLAHIGETRRSADTPKDETSENLGLAELRRFLPEAGVHEGDVIFEEGSGLSRNNLTTPDATVALLSHMSRHPAAAAYYEALPIAGVDGTLKNRMKGTPAAGNVHAKTGTLRWANSVSGYVTTAAGEHLVFSVMLNRYNNVDPNRSARTELDLIPILLAGFTGRSSE